MPKCGPAGLAAGANKLTTHHSPLTTHLSPLATRVPRKLANCPRFFPLDLILYRSS
jgi:hypothetical protein